MDSDDEWLAELLGRTGAASDDNDNDAESWMRELLAYSRSASGRCDGTSLHRKTSAEYAAAWWAGGCDRPSLHRTAIAGGGINVPATTAIASVPPQLAQERRTLPPRPRKIPADERMPHLPLERRMSRRLGDERMPVLPLDLRSQHVDVLVHLSVRGSSIRHSLLRTWLSSNPVDYTCHSLESLADSCTARVVGLVDTTPPCIFKIGLTRDPQWRFCDAPFAYHPEYHFMELLVVSSSKTIQYLERAMISRSQHRMGCRNQAPGGESPPPDSMVCYLYVVWTPVEDFIADRLRAIRSPAPKLVAGVVGGTRELRRDP